MRGRIKTLLAGTLVLAVILATAGAASADVQTVRIRSVEQKSYPQVTLTVAVGSDGTVSAGDLRITENGRVVKPLSVQTLQQTGRGVDVVLAIDVSNSVKGEALETALAAARDFVQRLPEGVRVGVVTFSNRAAVLRNLTGDRAEVLDVLGPTKTHLGTALYEGVTTAAEMFSAPGQRNIVLFTDGSNTSGGGTLPLAIAAAKSAGASIFTVGLQSRELDPDVLRTLARETGGAYTAATEASLGSIYQELARELSHQFEVTFRSTSGRGAQVTLAVSAGGVEDTALVLTPESKDLTLPAKTEIPVLTGTVGLTLALGLSFLAAFLLLIMLLGATYRNRRRRELARRMATDQFAEPVETHSDRSETGVASWIPEPLVAAAEKIAQAGGFATGVDQKLERAGLPLSTGEFIALNAGTTLLGLVIGGLIFQSPLFTLLLAVAGAVAPSFLVNRAIGRRTNKLHSQLADVVTVLASSLRAGHSFFQALDMVSKEVGDPAGPEFQRLVTEVRLGRPVEEALTAMGERVGSEDFKWAILAVNIQREVGGNLAEILDTVAETVREREVLRRQVRVLSAEGRLSVKILIALPFLIGLYILKVNPGYMNLLFSTQLGWILLGTGSALMLLGAIWARKLVKMDV